MGAGLYVSFDDVVLCGKTPTSSDNSSRGIPIANVNIQSVNPGGKKWSGVGTVSTIDAGSGNPIPMDTIGMFMNETN